MFVELPLQQDDYPWGMEYILQYSVLQYKNAWYDHRTKPAGSKEKCHEQDGR